MNINLLGLGARHGLSSFEQIAIIAVLVVAFISLALCMAIEGDRAQEG